MKAIIIAAVMYFGFNVYSYYAELRVSGEVFKMNSTSVNSNYEIDESEFCDIKPEGFKFDCLILELKGEI